MHLLKLLLVLLLLCSSSCLAMFEETEDYGENEGLTRLQQDEQPPVEQPESNSSRVASLPFLGRRARPAATQQQQQQQSDQQQQQSINRQLRGDNSRNPLNRRLPATQRYRNSNCEESQYKSSNAKDLVFVLDSERPRYMTIKLDRPDFYLSSQTFSSRKDCNDFEVRDLERESAALSGFNGLPRRDSPREMALAGTGKGQRPSNTFDTSLLGSSGRRPANYDDYDDFIESAVTNAGFPGRQGLNFNDPQNTSGFGSKQSSAAGGWGGLITREGLQKGPNNRYGLAKQNKFSSSYGEESAFGLDGESELLIGDSQSFKKDKPNRGGFLKTISKAFGWSKDENTSHSAEDSDESNEELGQSRRRRPKKNGRNPQKQGTRGRGNSAGRPNGSGGRANSGTLSRVGSGAASGGKGKTAAGNIDIDISVKKKPIKVYDGEESESNIFHNIHEQNGGDAFGMGTGQWQKNNHSGGKIILSQQTISSGSAVGGKLSRKQKMQEMARNRTRVGKSKSSSSTFDLFNEDPLNAHIRQHRHAGHALRTVKKEQTTVKPVLDPKAETKTNLTTTTTKPSTMQKDPHSKDIEPQASNVYQTFARPKKQHKRTTKPNEPCNEPICEHQWRTQRSLESNASDETDPSKRKQNKMRRRQKRPKSPNSISKQRNPDEDSASTSSADISENTSMSREDYIKGILFNNAARESKTVFLKTIVPATALDCASDENGNPKNPKYSNGDKGGPQKFSLDGSGDQYSNEYLYPNGAQALKGNHQPNGPQYPKGSQYSNGAQYPKGSQYPNSPHYQNGDQSPNGAQHPNGNHYPNGPQHPNNSKYPNGSQRPFDPYSKNPLGPVPEGFISADLMRDDALDLENNDYLRRKLHKLCKTFKKQQRTNGISKDGENNKIEGYPASGSDDPNAPSNYVQLDYDSISGKPLNKHKGRNHISKYGAPLNGKQGGNKRGAYGCNDQEKLQHVDESYEEGEYLLT